ncbi:hypothetical protein SAMN05421868_12527 [Paenibacillus naphthalenovorans]|nr:hypothetical protein SAMN05421868_12527 [Paenibacillus naphthalenovorans]
MAPTFTGSLPFAVGVEASPVPGLLLGVVVPADWPQAVTNTKHKAKTINKLPFTFFILDHPYIFL